MLKTRQGKKGSCKGIQRYLERGGRSLALDCNYSIGDPARWGECMDADRKIAGKNSGRRYYHFILSPAPEDNPTLDQIRTLAISWAKENYPDGQWAIEYHDDNNNGVLHAHVVLNAYDPVSGNKIHRSDKKVEREANSLNRICEQLGLSPMQDIKIDMNRSKEKSFNMSSKESTIQDRKYTKAELELLSKGVVLWKDRLLDAIETTAPKCSDFNSFQAALRTLGIETYVNKRGQIVYVPPKAWNGYPSKDKSIGYLATKDHLMSVFTPDLGGWAKDRQVIEPKVAEFRVPQPKFPTYADLLARKARPYSHIKVKRLANAISTLRSQNITSYSDLEAKFSEISQNIEETKMIIDALAERQESAALALEKISVLERYEHIWGQYSEANGRERKAYEKSHAKTISECKDAFEWLEDRGLTGEGDFGRIEATYIETQSRIEAMRTRLDEAKAALTHLRSVIKTVDQINTYNRIDTRSFRITSVKDVQTSRIRQVIPVNNKPRTSLIATQRSSEDLKRKLSLALEISGDRNRSTEHESQLHELQRNTEQEKGR